MKYFRFSYVSASTGEVYDFDDIIELNNFVIAECINEPYYVIDRESIHEPSYNPNGLWLIDPKLEYKF